MPLPPALPFNDAIDSSYDAMDASVDRFQGGMWYGMGTAATDLGTALGSKYVQQLGNKANQLAAENYQLAQQHTPEGPTLFTQVLDNPSLSNFGQWAKNTAIEQAPLLGTQIGAGIAGSIVAGPIGALSAAALAGAPMHLAENQARQEETGVNNLAAKYGATGVNALLDSIVLGKAGNVLSRSMGIGGPLSKATLRGQVAKGVISEATTEAAQGSVTDYQAGIAPSMEQEYIDARINEAAAGGLLGGGINATTHMAGAPRRMMQDQSLQMPDFGSRYDNFQQKLDERGVLGMFDKPDNDIKMSEDLGGIPHRLKNNIPLSPKQETFIANFIAENGPDQFKELMLTANADQEYINTYLGGSYEDKIGSAIEMGAESDYGSYIDDQGNTLSNDGVISQYENLRPRLRHLRKGDLTNEKDISRHMFLNKDRFNQTYNALMGENTNPVQRNSVDEYVKNDYGDERIDYGSTALGDALVRERMVDSEIQRIADTARKTRGAAYFKPVNEAYDRGEISPVDYLNMFDSLVETPKPSQSMATGTELSLAQKFGEGKVKGMITPFNEPLHHPEDGYVLLQNNKTLERRSLNLPYAIEVYKTNMGEGTTDKEAINAIFADFSSDPDEMQQMDSSPEYDPGLTIYNPDDFLITTVKRKYTNRDFDLSSPSAQEKLAIGEEQQFHARAGTIENRLKDLTKRLDGINFEIEKRENLARYYDAETGEFKVPPSLSAEDKKALTKRLWYYRKLHNQADGIQNRIADMQSTGRTFLEEVAARTDAEDRYIDNRYIDKPVRYTDELNMDEETDADLQSDLQNFSGADTDIAFMEQESASDMFDAEIDSMSDPHNADIRDYNAGKSTVLPKAYPTFKQATKGRKWFFPNEPTDKPTVIVQQDNGSWKRVQLLEEGTNPELHKMAKAMLKVPRYETPEQNYTDGFGRDVPMPMQRELLDTPTQQQPNIHERDFPKPNRYVKIPEGYETAEDFVYYKNKKTKSEPEQKEMDLFVRAGKPALREKTKKAGYMRRGEGRRAIIADARSTLGMFIRTTKLDREKADFQQSMNWVDAQTDLAKLRKAWKHAKKKGYADLIDYIEAHVEALQASPVQQELQFSTTPEAAKKRWKREGIVQDNDDLLTAVAKLGGIFAPEAYRSDVDEANSRMQKAGIRYVVNNNGKTMSELYETLTQEGMPFYNQFEDQSDFENTLVNAVNSNSTIMPLTAEPDVDAMVAEYEADQMEQEEFNTEKKSPVYVSEKDEWADAVGEKLTIADYKDEQQTLHEDIMTRIEKTDNLSSLHGMRERKLTYTRAYELTGDENSTGVSGATIADMYREIEAIDAKIKKLQSEPLPTKIYKPVKFTNTPESKLNKAGVDTDLISESFPKDLEGMSLTTARKQLDNKLRKINSGDYFGKVRENMIREADQLRQYIHLHMELTYDEHNAARKAMQSPMQEYADSLVNTLGVSVKLVDDKRAIEMTKDAGVVDYISKIADGVIHGFTSNSARAGKFEIFVNGALNDRAQKEILHHELGHAVFNHAWKHADAKTIANIAKEYQAWLKGAKKKNLFAKLIQEKKTPEAAILYLKDVANNARISDLSPKDAQYVLDFEEWFADKAAKVFEKQVNIKPYSISALISKVITKLTRAFGRDNVGVFIDSLKQKSIPTPINQSALVKFSQGVEQEMRKDGGIISALKKIIYDKDVLLRDTKIPALQKFAGLMYKTKGDTSTDNTWWTAKQRMMGTFDSRLKEIMRGVTLNDQQTLMNELYNKVNNPSAKARQIRALYRDIADYMEQAGIKLNRRKDYFPEMVNVPYLIENEGDFLAMMEKYQKEMADIADSRNKQAAINYLSENGYPITNSSIKQAMSGKEFTLLTAADMPKQIFDHLVSDNGVIDVEIGGKQTPGMRFLNTRILDFMKGSDIQNWKENYLQQSVMDATSEYIMQSVKRAEYERRFGGEKLHDILQQARDEGASQEQIQLAYDTLSAEMGTYGHRTARRLTSLTGGFIPEPLQRSPINPGLQRIQSTLMTVGNLWVLGMSTLTSLVDPVGIAVRTGSPSIAFKALKAGIRAEFSRDTSELAHLSESLGAISDIAIKEALRHEHSSHYMTPKMQKLNDGFFKAIGLEKWTRMTRLMATQAGLDFITRHDKRPNGHSKRFLAELGLQNGDIQYDKDGKLKFLTYDEYQNATDTEKARDDRMKNALSEFIDSSILRPNPSQRPLWASDPHFALLFHLKSFMYAFQKTILNRAAYEAIQHNLAPLAALGLYVPVALAAQSIKDIIKTLSDDDEDYTPDFKNNWGFADYLWDGVYKSGLVGITQPVFDMARDRQFGGTGLMSMFSPGIDPGTYFTTSGAPRMPVPFNYHIRF